MVSFGVLAARNKPFWKIPAITLLAMVGMSTGCSRSDEKPRSQKFPMTGEILRIDQARSIATIKHHEIVGWMEAMTMDFPIRSDIELNNLREGMKIQGTVYVQGLEFWLADVQVTADPP